LPNKILGLLLFLGATVLSAWVESLKLGPNALLAATSGIYVAALLLWVWLRQRSPRAGTRDRESTAEKWQMLEKRFELISGEIQVIWQFYPATGLVQWTVTPQTSGANQKCGTARDRDRFLAEARTAGRAVRRLGTNMPAKFSTQAATDAADDWLNAVADLVHPNNELRGAGSNGLGDLGRYNSGFISDAVAASRDACARLAALQEGSAR